MSMKSMEDLREKICDELEELAEKVSRENKISMADLEKIGELVDIKKNLLKVEKLEDEVGYSQDGGWETHGRFGNSYRGRKRDSMGRYSRAKDGYSRDGGEELMEHVEMMMESAETPEQREMIKRFKKQLEQL